MRVTQVGRANRLWAREFECPGCGSVLEVCRDDLALEYKHDMSGARHKVVASCCVCDTQIVVDDPAHKDWGALPHKTSCMTCRISCLVPAENLEDPTCPTCRGSVEIRKVQAPPTTTLLRR